MTRHHKSLLAHATVYAVGFALFYVYAYYMRNRWSEAAPVGIGFLVAIPVVDYLVWRAYFRERKRDVSAMAGDEAIETLSRKPGNLFKRTLHAIYLCLLLYGVCFFFRGLVPAQTSWQDMLGMAILLTVNIYSNLHRDLKDISAILSKRASIKDSEQ